MGAPAGAAPGAGRTGIVETTRGGALAGWTGTGCSSRDTSLSGAPDVVAPAGFDAAFWASVRFGTILFGASFALMTGGSDAAEAGPCGGVACSVDDSELPNIALRVGEYGDAERILRDSVPAWTPLFDQLAAQRRAGPAECLPRISGKQHG